MYQSNFSRPLKIRTLNVFTLRTSLKMAPSTRSTNRIATPSKRSEGSHSDTPKKGAFFRAYDTRDSSTSVRAISRDFGISHPTALRWLHDREINGSPAYRQSRRRSDKLGRRSKVSAETCEMLVSLDNPVRDQSYEAQISFHDIPIKRRALRTQLAKHTNGGQMYKMAYIKKELSAKNIKEREHYGQNHQGKTIDGFWQYIVFSDEAHFDPSSRGQGKILREKGQRYNPENIQQRGSLTGNTLHFAAWVNWHAKAPELLFYNDENSYTEKPKRDPRPRKSKYESQEEFESRVLVWQAAQPHDKEVKPKGNAMTQLYYTQKLLPTYIKAIQKLRIYGPASTGDEGDWLFQEDGDPSHGLKTKGLAQQLKDSNWVTNLPHPAQSPDLNPQEAVWNILKQRVRQRIWHSEEELKAILQEEWSLITMEEVRARISEMPRRCKLLVKYKGKPIRSALW